MVTPLSDRDTLDDAGLERLIEHILAGGVHGLFILGTTGEAPSLSYRLRRGLIEPPAVKCVVACPCSSASLTRHSSNSWDSPATPPMNGESKPHRLQQRNGPVCEQRDQP